MASSSEPPRDQHRRLNNGAPWRPERDAVDEQANYFDAPPTNESEWQTSDRPAV
jgi:hypothetical protein